MFHKFFEFQGGAVKWLMIVVLMGCGGVRKRSGPEQPGVLKDVKLPESLRASRTEAAKPLAPTVEMEKVAPKTAKIKPSDPKPEGGTEGHIELLRKAEKLIGQKHLHEALGVVKKIGAAVPQVEVRGKFLWGEILFLQGEYDLAMQMYEAIIQKHAFSGLVLKTLKRLIVCSEKLKLEAKRKKYHSILHDFFKERD